MTAAPSRHGHLAPASDARPPGGAVQTVTPLPLPQASGPIDPDPAPAATRSAGWRSALVTAAVMAVIWAALLGDQPGSWVLGVPAILGGVALAAAIPGAPETARASGSALRLSPAGALRFAAWFARQSVLGASDVAWRACDPRLPIAPGFRDYATGLPPGAPRTLFANCITLLPGTLSADIRGARLTIHMLDRTQDLDRDLGQLEARIGAVWGLPPARGPRPGAAA